MPIRKFADAIAFEVECDRNTRLQFAPICSGLKRELIISPTEILDRYSNIATGYTGIIALARDTF